MWSSHVAMASSLGRGILRSIYQKTYVWRHRKIC